MELEKSIKGRRSVRVYNNEPVSTEQIEAVIEAGTWAPTGNNRQPWKFIIIQNKELIKYVSDETKRQVQQAMPALAKQFSAEADIICYNAPVLTLVCTEKNENTMFDHVDLLDSVLAAQNMFLKAYELGLGTCYMGFVHLISSKPEARKKLGIPDGYDIKVPFIMGHPKNKINEGKRNKPNIQWVN
jgi:nitroreductase